MSTDAPARTRPARNPLLILVIIAVGVAAWILASFTVGDSLAPGSAEQIGFAVALLVVAAAVSLWVLWDPNRPAVLPLGLALVGGGTLSVLMAVGLQFYLAGVLGDQGRRVAELLSERQRLGQDGNLNLNIKFPPSVQAVSYLAVLGGLGMVAAGIRVAVGRAPAGPPPLPAAPPVGPV